MRVLIVDDEPLAHQVLRHHLAAHADMQLVGCCFSAAEAMAWLAREPVDLLLLDIQLPVLTGLEMLHLLAAPPQVVLVTAYAEFALDGYRLDVTDYLLKPVSAERFAAALHKVRRRHREPVRPTEPSSSPGAAAAALVLKVDRAWRRFDPPQICCLEAYGNYVKVWQGTQVTLASTTLKALMHHAALAGFIQVHKSFVVNPAHVVGLHSQQVQLSNQQQIKIGDSFRAQARQIFGGG